MATSRAANVVEKVVGHRDNAGTEQDVSNPANKPEEWGVPGQKMKALVWKGKHSVELVEAPKPKIIEDDDVIIKVTGTTVCGSDLHLYNGVIPQLQSGDILGHEFCGHIDEVGPKITKFKKGQRVVASFQIACGECRNCKRQLSAHCERANANKTMNNLYGGHVGGIFGYSHLLGGFAGGQAEYVRVPWGDAGNLLPLPDGLPDEKGLYLSDVLCTAWHCVVDSGVKDGDTVAVWGGGPIGQMVCEISFLKGAQRVILVDGGSGAWRLDFVKSKLPKLEELDYSQLSRGESVTSKLKEMTDGVGPDVCLECAGGEYAKGWLHSLETAIGAEMDTSELLNEMVTAVRAFGTCGIIADYIGYTNHFNIGAVMEKGVRLIGNGQAPVQKYWKDILRLVQNGKLDPLHMVTHRVKLEEMETAYRKFYEREKGVQKIFVQTQFSDAPSAGTPQLSSFTEE